MSSPLEDELKNGEEEFLAEFFPWVPPVRGPFTVEVIPYLNGVHPIGHYIINIASTTTSYTEAGVIDETTINRWIAMHKLLEFLNHASD
jgi:hypothetical protein